MKIKIPKRKYEKKLIRRIVDIKENRDFLLNRLRHEWEEIEKHIERNRRKEKWLDVTKNVGVTLGFTILTMAAVCGIVMVGAIAPNVLSVFGRSGRHRRYFDRKIFQKKVAEMKYRGYLSVVKNGDGRSAETLTLTKSGEEQVMRRSLFNIKVPALIEWDGIWRVVIFDIPERYKWAREGIREALKRGGFYPLQKSTFVSPYPCRGEIEFLERIYNIRGYLRFIETHALSADDDIKDFFGLA